MKTTSFLLFLLCASLFADEVSPPAKPATDTDGLRVVSPSGLRDMPLGCASETVVNIMGPPQKKETFNKDIYYSYNTDRPSYLVRRGLLPSDKAIGFTFDSITRKLNKIFIEDSFPAKTDKGVHFGDTIAKVLQLYGKPTSQYPPSFDTESAGAWLNYEGTENGILFDFHDGVVTGIRVFVHTEPPPASSPAPTAEHPIITPVAPTPKPEPNTVTPIPQFTTVAEAQQAALLRFPELSVAGSKLNDAFVARYKLYQQTRPDYFRDTSWPLRLAEEVTHALKAQ